MWNLKFSIHTTNHRKILNFVQDSDWEWEVEKTDLGYNGTISSDVSKDAFVGSLTDISRYIISLVIVVSNEDHTVSGYAYVNSGDSLTHQKSSRNHDPQLWHGIAYKGLHLDGE